MFMDATKFGVEIEFCGITRRDAAGVVCAALNGETVNHEAGGYDKYTIEAPNGTIWTIMRDASIDADELKKCELVTPILKGQKDIEVLQNVIRALRKFGAKVNESCGVHVHVSHDEMDMKALRRLCIMWASKENAIYKVLEVASWRENHYCKKTDVDFLSWLRKHSKVDGGALENAWYEGASIYSRNRHYHDSRYHSLNLHSFFQHRNVEFRCFNSTLHAGKIKAYVQFCCAMVQHAVEKKSATYSEMPCKKANMADWFVRIGLVGEEYKTCRLHMSNNLAA